MSQPSNRADSNGNRPSAGPTSFSRQSSGAAARGRGGTGRGSAQSGRTDATNSRNKGARNQGQKQTQDPSNENTGPPGLTFQGPSGASLLSFGSFNSDASGSETGPSRTTSSSIVNGPSSPPRQHQRTHPQHASADLPEKIMFGNFQAGSPGGPRPQPSPPRHTAHAEALPSMSPSQLQQQLAQRQHDVPHPHPQIMQRPPSQALEGQHPQGAHRHGQQQLQFGMSAGHPHQGMGPHTQQGHPGYPAHLQHQQPQPSFQMGGHIHQGHPAQTARSGSSSSSASGQGPRASQPRGGRGSSGNMPGSGQAGPKGMTPNTMNIPYQQMYSGQAGMVWGAFPSQVAHPYNMNDGQNAAYQQILAQQTLGHPSHLSSYPPGINPAYQTPNYGQQGNQQGAPNQSRGGSSRGGHSSGQGSQGGRGGQQNATPSAAPPAKPSRVLKITNPADGAEVHVEQIKKAEKAAASAPSSRASSGTRVLDIVAPGDKPPAKKGEPAAPKVATPPPATSEAPASPAGHVPSLSVPAVSAPLGQPQGAEESLSLNGDAPAIPRGPSEPVADAKPAQADAPGAEAIPKGPVQEPLKAAASEMAKEGDKAAEKDSAPAAAKTEEGSSKVATVQAVAKEAAAAATSVAKPSESPEAPTKPDDKPAAPATPLETPPGKGEQKSAGTKAEVLKDADTSAPSAAVEAAQSLPSTAASEDKSMQQAAASGPTKAADAKPVDIPVKAAAASGKENAQQNETSAAGPGRPKSPEDGSVAEKILRLQRQHEAEAVSAGSGKREIATAKTPSESDQAAPVSAASKASDPSASPAISKKPADDKAQSAAQPQLQQVVEKAHAEPAEESAKGSTAAATAAEPDSKATAEAAASQEATKTDGPSHPPAPAPHTVAEAMPSKEEAKPEPMEVKANKMEAVSVTSAGAVSPAAAASSASAEKAASGEEAAAKPAVQAPSKKTKKGQLGMKEGTAAGFLDPFAAPSAPTPAPAPTPAASKAPEPAPAATPAPAPQVEEAADDWEDQTAPAIPRPPSKPDLSDGRKVYSRDFLRQFDMFTDVPEGLPVQSAALRDILNPELLGQPGSRGPPVPARVMNGPPGMPVPADSWNRPARGGPGGFAGPGRGMGPGPPRPGMGGMGGPPAPPRMADDSWGKAKPGPPGVSGAPPPRVNRPAPSLHRSDNRYKVGTSQSDDPEEEKKQKEFKSLLNKITPDTFERIYAKLKDVPITHHTTLEGLINQVFDKALIEPKFCELYADLCFQLNTVLPDFEDPEGRTDAKGQLARVNFRKMLINKCQAEFEKGSEAKAAVDQRDKAREDAGKSPDDNSDDEADKEDGEVEAGAAPQTKEERLEARRAQRRQNEEQAMARLRLLGNMQFVGHLFKKKMLTEKIMHFCIRELLKDLERPQREDIECLSKLLATIGGVLDAHRVDNNGRMDKGTTQAARNVMDAYFVRIKSMSENQRLESRLRFMLQDTIELRSKGWVQRRAADGPKKIEEVHMEAKRELMAQRAAQDAQSRGGFRGRQESFSRNTAPPPVQRRPQDSRPDAPFRTMQATGDTDSVGLRPGGFRPALGGGPAGGRPATFGPARVQAAESQRPPGPPPAPAAPPAANTNSPSAPAVLNRQPSAAPSEPAAEAKLSNKAQLRVGGLLEEYISNQNRADAEQDFRELLDDEEDPGLLLVAFFRKAAGGRQRAEAAAAIPELAGMMVEVWGAAQAHPRLHHALAGYLDELVDEVTDSPFLPGWLGTVFGKMVAEETITFSPLAHVLQEAGTSPDADESLVENGAASTLLGSMLQQLLQSGDNIESTWASSNLKLTQFFPESTSAERISQWKKKYELSDKQL